MIRDEFQPEPRSFADEVNAQLGVLRDAIDTADLANAASQATMLAATALAHQQVPLATAAYRVRVELEQQPMEPAVVDKAFAELFLLAQSTLMRLGTDDAG